MKKKSKLPISAIVVGLNEGELLRKSLPKLNFCDEILYFDLGSNDYSIKIAEDNHATVINHERVLMCECIHSKYYKITKHQWVLIIDPDEILSEELVKQVENTFTSGLEKQTDIGCISVPWIFFFKKKKLKGTVWGGTKSKILLINNQRFDFRPLVHVGRELQVGYKSMEIPFEGNNQINHYWMTSFSSLFEKHKRYLKNEGEARYKTGQKTTLLKIVLEPVRAFKTCYIDRKGYKDGFIGIFLSLFWCWYQTTSAIQLYKYQLSQQC